MGKIVKFCNACEEGFAEKFGFCPNCGAQLTAFEMNPLDNKAAETPKNEPIETVQAAAAPAVVEAKSEEIPAIAETSMLKSHA